MEALLRDLDERQREAVTTPASPLCILAGAGSGKTRVLTRRIAHRVLTGDADAPHVLVLTFTRKAAGELRSRLARLGVRDGVVAGTFHAVAYAQLRRRWADRGEHPPALLERKLRVLGPIVGNRRPDGRRGTVGSPAVQPADVAAEIEWAKARLVPASQYVLEATRAGRTPPVAPEQIAAWYERYEAEKKRRGVVDFDDLLTLAARAFETDEEFATTQRWRFRHLFVDEFQDVNPVQFHLLRGWLGGRDDLCVVGDPNQAIYSWNGADPRLLESFEQLFPGATTVRLDHNYRSTPQVVATAAAVLPGGTAPRALRPDGPLPTVRSYSSEKAEANGIAAAIRRQHGATRPWSAFAVLTRTNAQALVFEEALRSAQIPFRIRGAGRFLDQPEVVDALASLETAVTFEAFVADVDELVRAGAGTDERRANLQNLVRLAREHAMLDPAPTPIGFKTWLAASARDDDPDRGGDAVEVVTFHRAKGLEWPVVFVAGLERGLVPIGRAESDEAEAEERRLLYVALTRAEEQLHCSWAERRTFGEATVARHPSPWLADVEDAVARLAGREVRTAPPENVRRFVERARSQHAGRGRSPLRTGPAALGDAPHPGVFAALKAWRSRAARAANVPAYVIFHDTTLAAVAEARPTTRDALLEIPGLGPLKAERYGDELLRLVAEHGDTA
jgi:DNA helicase-2/ATP-dependent DNA helicase PcrA